MTISSTSDDATPPANGGNLSASTTPSASNEPAASAEPERRHGDGRRSPLIERPDAVKAIVWAVVVINLFAAALAVRLWRAPPAPAEPLRFVTDVNTAPATELALLPGIGVELAKRIVIDRTAHGGYRSADELQRVPGIGPKTVDRLGPLVTFSNPDPATPPDDRDRE